MRFWHSVHLILYLKIKLHFADHLEIKVCSECLTPVQLQSFDVNGDGVLDKIEFEEFTRQMGVFLTTQELRVVFDAFDLNKDGRVQYSELLTILKVSVFTTDPV